MQRQSIALIHQPERPILLTALYINNQLVSPRTRDDVPNIRYTNSIELKYNQNNLSFELSDLPYSLDEKNKFVYRLEGMDKEWNFLKSNINRITYSNLSYGNYQLIISKLGKDGQPSDQPYILNIRILPPWYYTIWAKAIYVLLLLSLIAWTINFFRVKNRLKAERREKEKILEQSRQKMAFFTTLSNELKTPLSRIIAPISQLLPATDRIFKAGGVQAIGAMAYGTESVPKVYKIFGPGNQYVMAAKQQVSLHDVAIDMPAGPSEVEVLADAGSNPVFVAADLLSQAEHGVDSQVLLVTTDEALVGKVQNEVERQLAALPRKEIAEQALAHSKLVVVRDMDEALELTNRYAPEHLIIETADYMQAAERVVNAGSVFLGFYTPESAGDYASVADRCNHT